MDKRAGPFPVLPQTACVNLDKSCLCLCFPTGKIEMLMPSFVNRCELGITINCLLEPL